ncbi:DUF4423 domain-containing protein [Myxococcota bacterium]|nr:DUF4423 domain-containing protein [Myxococcota bacterium]
MDIDFDQVACELLRALRGRRSQVQWSRRLGYRSNVAWSWEKGRRWPTGAETLRACRRAGVDPADALTRFYGQPPTWLPDVDPATPQAVALLLDDLRGSTTVVELARLAGLSRYSVTRWLSGQTQPRLPDLLRVVEAASTRMVDLVACLVDPLALPSVAPHWRAIQARRRSAAELPWTQAVLRAVELAEYQALPAHEPGWIARRLGIQEEEEARCVAFLRNHGQLIWTGTHFQPQTRAVDTRALPEVGRTLKAHWSRVAADRIEGGRPGQFSYNVFTCSRADLERIRQAHLAYFHALRAIVADSQPDEVVVVANVQLFPLEPGEGRGG